MRYVTFRNGLEGDIEMKKDGLMRRRGEQRQIQAYLDGGASTAIIEGIVEKVVERKLKEAGVLK